MMTYWKKSKKSVGKMSQQVLGWDDRETAESQAGPEQLKMAAHALLINLAAAALLNTACGRFIPIFQMR